VSVTSIPLTFPLYVIVNLSAPASSVASTVNKPLDEITVPAFVPPATSQVISVAEVGSVEAVNCCVSPAFTLAVFGATVAVGGCGDGASAVLNTTAFSNVEQESVCHT